MIRIVGVVVMLRETSLERLWFLKKAVGLSISPPIISRNQESLSTSDVNYSKYAPSYTYTKTGDDEADYYLQATKETYIPYYGTTTYAKFVFNVNLHFITEVSGTYTGVQTNGYGDDSRIQGNFILN